MMDLRKQVPGGGAAFVQYQASQRHNRSQAINWTKQSAETCEGFACASCSMNQFAVVKSAHLGSHTKMRVVLDGETERLLAGALDVAENAAQAVASSFRVLQLRENRRCDRAVPSSAMHVFDFGGSEHLDGATNGGTVHATSSVGIARSDLSSRSDVHDLPFKRNAR